MSILTIQDNITAVAGTIADREAFGDALEAGRYPGAAAMVAKFDQVGGNESTTTIDNSGYVEDALFELDYGQILNAGSFKGYKSTWDIEQFSKRITFNANDIEDLKSEGFNPVKMVDRANTRYVTFAQKELVKTIKAMYATTASRYDDNTALWFALTGAPHSLGGTDYFNHEATAVIAAATAIATNYVNFDTAVTEWEKAPDTEGNEMGFGNRWHDNGLAVISANLAGVFRKLENSQSMAIAGDNVYYKSLNHVVLPGLTDDTVIITRKPTDTIPGFTWSEAFVETLVPERGGNGSTSYNYIYSVRMAMTGTIWMASRLVL